MFRMLVDTCVWLDLARAPEGVAVLEAIEHMVERRDLVLLVPAVVLEEFRRNRSRVAQTEIRSLLSAVKRLKGAVWDLSPPKHRKRFWDRLNDLDLTLPTLGEDAVKILQRIETLLGAAERVPVSDGAKIRAAERALDGRAPFHHGKNAMADSLIIELYADCVARRQAGTRYAFVSHNKNDFSAVQGDSRQPHPDIAPLFSKVRSLYFTELPPALRKVNPALISQQLELQKWNPEARTATEIAIAIDELATKVWYDRHQVTKDRVERGWIKVVEKESYPRPRGRGHETIQEDIWRGAQRSARRVERRFGCQNLGPWSKFDWGMMNGKLSALRWVLGEDWDELYT